MEAVGELRKLYDGTSAEIKVEVLNRELLIVRLYQIRNSVARLSRRKSFIQGLLFSYTLHRALILPTLTYRFIILILLRFDYW